MEKVPNKYALPIRIICYILIPICMLAIVQSTISILYFAEQKQNKVVNNYYETQQFLDLYKQSIYNNVEACYKSSEPSGYEVNISNLYEVAEANTKNGDIYYKTYLENKNFKFLIIDNKTNKAFTNLEQTTKTDTIEKLQEELSTYAYYWNYENGNVKTNINDLTLENITYKFPYSQIKENYDCKIYTAIDNKFSYYDDYYESSLLYEIATKSNKTALINLPISFIIILVCIILITIYAGKKKGEKEIQLDVLDKVPLEIIAIFVLIILAIALTLCVEISYSMNIIAFITMLIICGIIYIIGLASYETFVKRIKTHTLFKNTITYRIFKFLVRTSKTIFNNFNLAAKIAIILIAFGIGTIILANSDFIGIVILLVLYAFAFKISLSYAHKILDIKETAKQIYEGNTEVRLKEDEYKGVLKELCVYINDIAGGFSNAIEKGIKSERMKTELITNVSHDIKTPLTSIINYVDLLKKEEMPNEKAKEYLDILDKKSQRLKRLTEDLVEASKASSGNIKLNMEKLDVKELIKQISGEFEDKLKEKKLDLILSMPEEDAFIMADSRYLYRVVENMYSNIVKYALPSSRVYVDIILDKENIRIELKNISKEKLNISADELMERFVRGESSRNTEGSGLGLSIAQSLTELQKGKFNIYLDGDLFKVTISFEKEH